jgi:hypothetical protein
MAARQAVETSVRDGLRRGKIAQAYTIDDHENPVLLANHSLASASQSGNVDVFIQSNPGPSMVAASRLDPNRWNAFWDFFDGFAMAKTQYGQIKKHPAWLALHDAQARPISYVLNDSLTSVMTPNTLACKSCGLVMPVEATTVDHRRPRKGGERSAAYKVLRAIGMTKDAPSGRKGRFLLDQSDFATNSAAPTAGALTWSGVTVLSCVIYAQQLSAFGETAVNHFVNLQPMCFRCNSQKGNWGY